MVPREVQPDAWCTFYRTARTFLQTSLGLYRDGVHADFALTLLLGMCSDQFNDRIRFTASRLLIILPTERNTPKRNRGSSMWPSHPPGIGSGFPPRDGSGPRQEVSPISRRRPDSERGQKGSLRSPKFPPPLLSANPLGPSVPPGWPPFFLRVLAANLRSLPRSSDPITLAIV